MVYGLLPLFLVQVLHSSMTSVGLIEGIAEGASSLMKIASGAATDWLGRRKPIVLFGYLVSAVNKLLFPLAESVTMVLAARVIDRLGKGVRDAPRDAFLADVTPAPVRGSGFGLRLAFYTAGFVVGPLTAMTIMRLSQHDFRLVFWLAVIPAAAAIAVLLVALREPPRTWTAETVPLKYLRGDLASLPRAFWWAVAIASLLSMARFSQAFLVLKAFDAGMDPAFVPTTLVVMHLAYACAAYPFGILADRVERRALLGIGVAVLTCADIVLASASTIPAVLVGAALWGLQLAVTQGLLSAIVADAAPRHLRGTAFGLYELAVGLAAFVASAAAGTFWTIGGPALSFGVSTLVASFAGVVLLFRPMPISNGSTGAG
jgi:MFS family permease